MADEDFAGHDCALEARVAHAVGVGLPDLGLEELGDEGEEGVGEEVDCACESELAGEF